MLVLDLPDMRNAMSDEMTESWVRAVDHLAGDPDLRAVVVTGEGSAFCAGGNTSWIAGEPDASVDRLRSRMLPFYRAWLSIRRLEVPTIAAINGPAIGAGLAVALACDIRYAARGARMGVPFVRLGMHPGMATTYLLPDVVGPAAARDLLLTGRLVDADEALGLGLVSRVLDPEGFREQVLATAAEIAATAPIATKLTKTALARRAREHRRVPGLGGARAAGHAGDGRPAGGDPGGPGEAGTGLRRSVTTRRNAGKHEEAPGARPTVCLPLANGGGDPGAPSARNARERGNAGQSTGTPACG